ncbi:MAG TPA: hypothetical protein VLT45_07810, partial [Kofleriaceae bacterium]|nr:hypothetical protein [Kofleriaceae bacterium]
DELADGKIVMPDPMSSLEIAKWRAQREYNQWLKDGAPEEVLEGLRQYVVQAIWMSDLAGQGAQNANTPGMPADAAAAAGGAPMAGPGGLPMPGPDMPMPLTDPANTQPQAALSQQAMMLRAG